MKKLFALVFASMAVLAQAELKTNTSDSFESIHYACDQKVEGEKFNQTLTVIYINTDKGSYAIAQIFNEMLGFRSVVSASGASYESMDSNYTYRIDTKGKDLILSSEEKTLLTCHY